MKPRVKRALKIAAVVLVLLVAIPAVPLVAAFWGTSDIQDGRELSAAVRVVKDGYTSAGMIDLGGGKIALVDAGNDAAGKAILAELTRRGAGPEAVTAILLTHGHPDHTAGCHLFPGAKIYALAAEVGLVEGRVAPPSPIGKVMGVKPSGITVSQTLADGETLTLGERQVRVFAVPGHTAGSAAYLIDGCLFVGDSAAGTTDGKIKAAPWLFSDDQAVNVASLRALAERLRPDAASVKFIVPAHSAVLEGLTPLLAFGEKR